MNCVFRVSRVCGDPLFDAARQHFGRVAEAKASRARGEPPERRQPIYLSAMLRKVTFEVGRAVRETGQALDRLGLRVLGDNAFNERCTFN